MWVNKQTMTGAGPIARHAVPAMVSGICGLALWLAAIGSAAGVEPKTPYPNMAPLAQYRMSRSAEIALARSAAPASIANDADVLVLGNGGNETAVKGKNGFVCVVERSWAKDFDDVDFWNPKIRGPICFNPAAARSVFADYLQRTVWVLAGVSKSAMLARTKAALAAKTVVAPEAGAMCYMMSKQGYLSTADGRWHPHLMFFLVRTDGATWGADLNGSPVFAAQDDLEHVTTFMVPVTNWSDGTPAVDATPAVMAMH
jgi:hypothetical protein